MVKVNGKELTREQFKRYLIKVRERKNAETAQKDKEAK